MTFMALDLKHGLLSPMKESRLHYASKVQTPLSCLKFTHCFIWNIFFLNHWIPPSPGTFLHAQCSECVSQSQGVLPKVLLWRLHVRYLLACGDITACFSSMLHTWKQCTDKKCMQGSNFPSNSLSTGVSKDLLWFPSCLLFWGLSSPTKVLLIT